MLNRNISTSQHHWYYRFHYHSNTCPFTVCLNRSLIEDFKVFSIFPLAEKDFIVHGFNKRIAADTQFKLFFEIPKAIPVVEAEVRSQFNGPSITEFGHKHAVKSVSKPMHYATPGKYDINITIRYSDIFCVRRTLRVTVLDSFGKYKLNMNWDTIIKIIIGYN